MKRMFMIVLLMFVLVVSACGSDTEDTVEENDEQANEVEESEEQSNDIEEKLDKADGADESQASEKEEETFSEVGILKEQIAEDMIEVETEETVTEFKLTKEAREDIEYVDVGDEVQYTYYEEDEEAIIGFIEKSEHYDKPRHHHEHHKHERHHRHQEHHKHPHKGHHHGPRPND